MTKVKEVSKKDERIIFEDGTLLYSHHEQDCCENHWLDFEHIATEDFEGLEFDLSNDGFFERIEGYGIALLPKNGHPVRIAGYGSNNGYYSTELTLVIEKGSDVRRYDITECQEINE